MCYFLYPFLRKEMVFLDYIIRIISFSKDKHEKFDRCPKCFGETKHRKLRDDELDFGGVLSRELHKRK